MHSSFAFDHLGFVVKRLARGREDLAALGARRWTEVLVDPVNGVRLQFGIDAAGVCYELLEPLDEASPVFAALRSGKGILNHVAYLVADLDEARPILESAGWSRTSDPKPALAYGGRRIQFFVSRTRLIVELIESPDHQHDYQASGE